MAFQFCCPRLHTRNPYLFGLDQLDICRQNQGCRCFRVENKTFVSSQILVFPEHARLRKNDQRGFISLQQIQKFIRLNMNNRPGRLDRIGDCGLSGGCTSRGSVCHSYFPFKLVCPLRANPSISSKYSPKWIKFNKKPLFKGV